MLTRTISAVLVTAVAALVLGACSTDSKPFETQLDAGADLRSAEVADLVLDRTRVPDAAPGDDLIADFRSPEESRRTSDSGDGGRTLPELTHVAELVVANPGGFDRTAEPVSRGVPLSRDENVLSADELYLEAPDGELVPAGFTPLARWGAALDDPGAPIKWVLVEFVLDIGAQQERTFTVKRGKGPHPEPTIAVEQSAGYLVDTGECQFVAGSGKQGFLSSVVCQEETFVSNLGLTDAFLSLGDGSQVAAGNLTSGEPVVHRQTDVSVTLLITGAFGQQQGWKRPLEYSLYLTFYGKTALVGGLLRIENRNKAIHPGNIWLLGSDGSLRFEGLAIRMPISAFTGEVDFHLLGENQAWTAGTGTKVRLYQDSSGGKNWNSYNHVNHAGFVPVTFKGYKYWVDEEEKGSGLRADGALVIGSPLNRAVGVTVRHFWQNFPKALRYDDGTLHLSLFPHDFNDEFELQGGEFKSHEFVLGFATGNDAQSRLKASMRGVHEPLIVRNPATYYCSTGAMLYDLAPRKAFVQDDWENTVDHVVLATGPSGRSMITQREAIDEYGWRNFGDAMADHETDCGNQSYDTPISHDNNQYDVTSIGFLQHARTDNMPQWFLFGEEYARHYLDIDVYHTQDDVAVYNGGVFAHTTHDANAGRSTHRTYPELELTQGCTQYQSGGPGLDYIHLDGLVLHHYFTGYPLTIDVNREIADWTITRLAGKYTGLSQREYSNCIRTMFTAYRLIHDDKYLQTARDLIAVADTYAAAFDGTAWGGAMVGKELGRYLDFQKEYALQDASTAQAHDALVSYANLALENHKATDVQAFRFSEMWLYAWKHAKPETPNRDAWRDKAFQTHEASIAGYWKKGDYSTQKEMTILSTNGNMYYWAKGPP